MKASTWSSSKRICPPIQETQVQSLGWEDALEEGMAAQSSTLSLRGESHRQRSPLSFSRNRSI